MHLEDKSKAFRHVVSKSQLAKLQEQRKAPEHYVQNIDRNMNSRRKGYPQVLPMRRNLELKSNFFSFEIFFFFASIYIYTI
jgi:hypothetical protein